VQLSPAPIRRLEWAALGASHRAPTATAFLRDGDRYLRRVGRRIRALRSRRGWTQAMLANHTELTREHISAVETARAEVGLRALEHIAFVPEIPMGELVDPLESSRNSPRSAPCLPQSLCLGRFTRRCGCKIRGVCGTNSSAEQRQRSEKLKSAKLNVDVPCTVPKGGRHAL
jgi:putative transcriptional regulator